MVNLILWFKFVRHMFIKFCVYYIFSRATTDIIFLRNKPESTTDNQLRKIDSILKNVRSDKLVINDVTNFYSIDNKDITFDIWGENNVKYPDFCLLYPNDIQKSIENIGIPKQLWWPRFGIMKNERMDCWLMNLQTSVWIQWKQGFLSQNPKCIYILEYLYPSSGLYLLE